MVYRMMMPYKRMFFQSINATINGNVNGKSHSSAFLENSISKCVFWYEEEVAAHCLQFCGNKYLHNDSNIRWLISHSAFQFVLSTHRNYSDFIMMKYLNILEWYLCWQSVRFGLAQLVATFFVLFPVEIFYLFCCRSLFSLFRVILSHDNLIRLFIKHFSLWITESIHITLYQLCHGQHWNLLKIPTLKRRQNQIQFRNIIHPSCWF